MDMEDILATQEQSLALSIDAEKSQSMQASLTATIEQLRSKIEQIEQQSKMQQ